MKKEMRKRGYRTIKVEQRGSELKIYASSRVADALEEVTEDMSLYHGVRLSQVIGAAYKQGMKDGAANAFKELRKGMKEAERLVPHKRPGRPKRKS